MLWADAEAAARRIARPAGPEIPMTNDPAERKRNEFRQKNFETEKWGKILHIGSIPIWPVNNPAGVSAAAALDGGGQRVGRAGTPSRQAQYVGGFDGRNSGEAGV